MGTDSDSLTLTAEDPIGELESDPIGRTALSAEMGLVPSAPAP